VHRQRVYLVWFDPIDERADVKDAGGFDQAIAIAKAMTIAQRVRSDR
jgi:hypothetical protein